jgi:hypothetical protein
LAESKSRLDNKDLVKELHLYLQSKGTGVKALDLVHYIDIPEVKNHLRMGRKKKSLQTAHHWITDVMIVYFLAVTLFICDTDVLIQ